MLVAVHEASLLIRPYRPYKTYKAWKKLVWLISKVFGLIRLSLLPQGLIHQEKLDEDLLFCFSLPETNEKVPYAWASQINNGQKYKKGPGPNLGPIKNVRWQVMEVFVVKESWYLMKMKDFNENC